MSERRPFSRHFWDLVDDERFADVFPDDHHYATWSRLLMLADQAWPASAHLPASARKASVAKLAAVGLISILPGGRFRVTGLDKAREERAVRAQRAADARWNATSNADSNASRTTTVMPRREEKRKEEKRKEEEVARPSSGYPDGDRDSLDTYHELTGFRPWGAWSGNVLKGAIRDYGDANLDAALRAEAANGATRDDLLKRALARLAKETDRAKEEAKSRPRVVKPTPDRKAINAEILRLMNEPKVAS